MKKMKKQLIELLNIHGVSGSEKPVRDYLFPILANLTDSVCVDNYGNLLAEKKIGNGNGEGATVLLSAHMDTVKGVLADRKLVETDGFILSDKGVLGADDRAGIAVVLQVLRSITTLSFNGNIKVAFTTEEEIGCKGSDKIDKDWYKDVDLAIVADRRGNRDIVVGCGMAFCSNNVGYFMEDVSKLCDMDWKCVEGGISDAMTFSENGVNSINLSVGFEHEHTTLEYVSVNDMKDTVRLILQTFAVINDFYKEFGVVPSENKWAKSWYKSSSSKSDYNYNGVSSYNYDDSFSDDIWAEENDKNGDVYVYEIGGDVIIQQGENEICLTKSSFKNILSQLKNV